MASLDSLGEMNEILEEWARTNTDGATDPVPILNRMSMLIEKETEAYFKMDPDPFDDRHPGSASPNCTLGHIMKTLFKNEEFMNKLVGVYMLSGGWEQKKVHVAASRLLIDIILGLETSVVFQETEGLVPKLFQWASTEEDPLSFYATGLLASAMELQDVATNFKEQNSLLVPEMLARLHKLRAKSEGRHGAVPADDSDKPNFGVFNKSGHEFTPDKNCTIPENSSPADKKMQFKRALSPSYYGEDCFKLRKSSVSKEIKDIGECSNSSWAEMEPYVIGSYCMDPLSLSMKQRLILQYLIPMGEYQELLSVAFDRKAMDLILYYINLKENPDVRLAFEALKYLATLLCHKKFATKFLNLGGVQRLLEVYRPSMAATGVSLCVYYLSYFEETMERVCLLPDHVLSDLVNYMLWLLECSHESSRCHAAIFFGHAFPFRIILELFNQKDGLRRLVNVVSTLPILNADTPSDPSADNKMYTMRQIARYVCMAFKKYMEAHLVHQADEIRRSHVRNENGSPLLETPSYKPLKLTSEVVQENIEMLLELMPLRMLWHPVVMFEKWGGINLVVQLLAIAQSWHNYPGKSETLCSGLDVLAVCTVTPRSQLLMLNSLQVSQNYSTSAISILVGLAEGETIQDPEVQKSALNVIINCVWGPMERLGGGVGRFMGSGSKKKINWKVGEDVLSKMWDGIRGNNGFMVLLKLLSIKTPISDADAIRTLACKALVGLSRSETVRQIISKLPLFNNGQLQQLMKEPILQDRRQEHVMFCKYASQLIERVSGKHHNTNIEASLQDIRRADIVAQTKIIFQERELLQLIHDHLVQKGFVGPASALQQEAGLPRCSTPPLIHPASPHVYSLPSTPKMSRQTNQPISVCGSYQVPHSSKDSTSGMSNTPGPIKFSLGRHAQGSPVIIGPGNKLSQQVPQKSRFLKDKGDVSNCSYQATFRKSTLKYPGESDISLDKIVTEYLRKQHALCRNPVVTCPPMSLFSPHKCPDPKGSSFAPVSITSRISRRSYNPRFGGIDGAKHNKKYIYSRFKPIRTIRDPDEDGYSCCSFSACGQFLLLGTYVGDLKPVNIFTGEESRSYSCHTSPIIHCEPSRDGTLMLTSAAWGTPLSSLWKTSDYIENQLTFGEDNHVEFSKHIQDKIIGTREERAHIYDLQTGTCTLSLFNPEKANFYNSNMATFNPSDDLVLNDGVLWDVRSGKAIHKFDKFNSVISGVFHPMGLEIIINSEVWDMRTFHLLHTVPALDQCQITFNYTADVIYGTIHVGEEQHQSDDRYRSAYASTFRTFDARDYGCIATYDVKSRSIFGLSTDKYDCHIAVVENQQFSDSGAEEYVCRLYEIGKLKDDEDDQGDEEEEGLEEDDEDIDLLGMESVDEGGSGDDDNDDDDDDDEDNDFQDSGDDESDDNDEVDIDFDDDNVLFELT